MKTKQSWQEGKIHTLVVEDEEIVAAVSAGVAQETVGDTEISGSAEDATTAWLTRKHELVVLDLHLPGMGGEEFCRWLREQEEGKDTFVLICTGDNKVETFKNVLAAGANDYISKPLQPKLLAVRLEVAKNQIYQTRRRRELQAEILRNEKRFRLISENSRDLVCTHRADGTLTYVSPSAETLLGRKASALIGTKLDGLRKDERAEPINLTAGADEENGQLESTRVWEVRHPDGRTLWLETYSQATRGIRNEVTEIYSYSRDITDAKMEEAQLKVLSVMGAAADTQSFLMAMIKEMEDRWGGDVVIHIHGRLGERNSYKFSKEGQTPAVVAFHTELDKTTPNDKGIVQSTGAAGVFHNVPGSEDTDAIICQPILGSFGKAIGKITISRKTPLPESERTKAVLTLCASKIGCVLEEHIMR